MNFKEKNGNKKNFKVFVVCKLHNLDESEPKRSWNADDADYADLRGFLFGFVCVNQRHLRSIKSLSILLH